LHGGGTLPNVDDIEETIQQHLADLAFLRQLKNAHNPLLRLPTELLRMILLYACPRPSQNLRKVWIHYLKDLIRFTQVCSRWHLIALSTPDLWSYLSCFTRKQSPLLLERSQQAPLCIYLEPATQRMSAHDVENEAAYIQGQRELLGLLRHLGRIRELELSAGVYYSATWHDETIEQLRSLLSAQAPMLAELVIEGHLSLQGHCLLDNHAPCLRTLRMLTVNVDLRGWLPLRNLHVLELTRTGQPTLHILNVLRDACCLRELTISTHYPEDILPEPPLEPVKLPSLRIFRFVGLGRPLRILLENVILPALLELFVTVDAEARTTDVQGMLGSDAVAMYLRRWSGLLEPLSIKNDTTRYHSGTKFGTFGSIQTFGKPILEMEIMSKPDGASTQQVLEAIVGALSVAQSQSLTITASEGTLFSPQGWLNAFQLGAPHALRELDITGPPALAFIHALMPEPGAHVVVPVSGAAADQCLLPGLAKATLHDIQFWSMTGRKLLVKRLKKALQARALKDCVAHLNLVFDRCDGLTREDLDMVQNVDAATTDSMEDMYVASPEG
jgi:hypothetical protein